MRFTQLGSTCVFGSGTCGVAPPNATTLPTLVRTSGGTHTVCLLETRSNQRSMMTVTSGGRVLVTP